MPHQSIPFVSTLSAEDRNAWIERLQAAMPQVSVAQVQDQSPDQWKDTECAIVAAPDPAVLLQMPKLRWVQSMWAGAERLVAELPPEVAIVRMTDPQLAKTMAEAVLTMVLYLHRDLPAYGRQQREKVWRQLFPVALPQDRTVTVLGLGELGRVACETLLRADFNVTGWSRSPKDIPGVQCFHGDDGLKQALGGADITVVLLPHTAATEGLLNDARFTMMKPGASVINFGRGPIIDDDALLTALASGHLSHAVLDVFDQEPLPQDSPLWTDPNITILPHVSGPTNMKTASAIAARNITAFFETGAIPKAVDRSSGY